MIDETKLIKLLEDKNLSSILLKLKTCILPFAEQNSKNDLEKFIDPILNIIDFYLDESILDYKNRNYLYDLFLIIKENFESNSEYVEDFTWIEAKFGIRKKEYINKNPRSIFQKLISDSTESFSIEGHYLYEQQMSVYKKMQEKITKLETFVISTPTSFGKTFLIQKQILSSKNIKNVVFIVPTIALQNEYLSKLLAYSNNIHLKANIYDDYFPLFSVNKSMEGYNFLVLTQEKTMGFLAQNSSSELSKIDYFIFDEFQEFISSPFDDRNLLFYPIFEKIEELNKPCIFLMPLVSSADQKIKESFFELKNEIQKIEEFQNFGSRNFYKLEFYNEKLIKMYVINSFLKSETNSNLLKETNFKNLLNTNKLDFIELIVSSYDSTIIFSKKSGIINLAQTVKPIKNFKITKEVELVIDYIQKNIGNTNYYLIDALKKGYACHHGDMDDFLRIQIEYLFKNKKIKAIIATSTLAHGVNLDADNIIFYDFLTKNIAKNDAIFTLDYKNIVGRVGRINNELGNVFFFRKFQRLDSVLYDEVFIDEKLNESLLKEKEDTSKELIFFNEINKTRSTITKAKLSLNSKIFPIQNVKNKSKIFIEIANNNYNFNELATPIISYDKINRKIDEKCDEIIELYKNPPQNSNEIANVLWELYGDSYFDNSNLWENLFKIYLSSYLKKESILRFVNKTWFSIKGDYFFRIKTKNYDYLYFDDISDEDILKVHKSKKISIKRIDKNNNLAYSIVVDYVCKIRKKVIESCYKICLIDLFKRINDKQNISFYELFNIDKIEQKLISFCVKEEIINLWEKKLESDQSEKENILNSNTIFELIDKTNYEDIRIFLKMQFIEEKNN